MDLAEPAFMGLIDHPAVIAFLERACDTGDRQRSAEAGGGLKLNSASALVLTPDHTAGMPYIAWVSAPLRWVCPSPSSSCSASHN